MSVHSQWVLTHLREYDSFLDSLRTIVDMGCGTGEDIVWWATLTTRDDPPEPYNYNCFAVDSDNSKLAQIPDIQNIKRINLDFNKPCIPVSADLMFAHDSLQYSINPLATLKQWNQHLNVNGMLVLCVKQDSGVEYNKYYSRTYNGCFYNFTPTNLIYMLAVNGFDCRDAYLLKQFNDPWINLAVYKSDVAPMDPATTTWQMLIDAGLLHPSIVNSINQNGFLRQEDIVMPWLDKENYFIDYISQRTEIPENIPNITNGVQNISIETTDNKLQQAPNTQIDTPALKPIKSMRPPKKKYD